MVDIPRKQDAISLLSADHEKLMGYFMEIAQLPREAGARRRRSELVAKIVGLLKSHLDTENTIFYPAASVGLGEDSVVIESSFEQDDEQYVIEQLEALSLTDPEYDAKVVSLSEQLREHVLQEETEIFPRLMAANIDMEALGVKIRRRQRGLA